MKQNEVIHVVPFSTDEPLCYIAESTGHRSRFQPVAVVTYSRVEVDADEGELSWEDDYEPILRSWYLTTDGTQFPMQRVFTLDEIESMPEPQSHV